MDRITVSIPESRHEQIQRLVDVGEYESKSEAVRELLRRGRRVEELEKRIEELERERQILIDSVEERTGGTLPPVDGGPVSRVRWLLFGHSND